MSNPKEHSYDPEAATLVPNSGASGPGLPASKNTAVQTPAPASPGADMFEAATMLDASPPAIPADKKAAGARATPVSAPLSSNVGSGLTLLPGTVIGNRYEVLQILGEGGMGAVYKARDIELDRVIALKVIRPELASNPEILQRFKQELILARQVTDRNVIRIFDLGEAGGIKFITMEYVEGEDLRSYLTRQKKLAVREAVDIVLQICRGLEAAHAEGVIHRDLKPQNVLRQSNGRIQVMDFGLARSSESEGLTVT